MAVSIELNGIDAEGERPPDEIWYHPDGDGWVELHRQSRSGVDDWRLVRGPKGFSKPVGDDFEAAFAEFAAAVVDAAGSDG